MTSKYCHLVMPPKQAAKMPTGEEERVGNGSCEVGETQKQEVV